MKTALGFAYVILLILALWIVRIESTHTETLRVQKELAELEEWRLQRLIRLRRELNREDSIRARYMQSVRRAEQLTTGN